MWPWWLRPLVRRFLISSDLGAGFHIAFEDLQLRGAGNLLGSQQHGFIISIGFDLYCRLLKESIEHLKTEIEAKHE